MKKILYIVVLILLAQTACKDEPCLKGTGSLTTQNRTLPEGIVAITLRDNLPLNIYPDTFNSITLKGGENVLDFVETEVVGNELIIENKNKCNFLRDFDQDIRLELHIRSLQSIYYEGSSNLVLKDTLSAEHFYFESASGAGDVTLLVKASKSATLKIFDGFSKISLYGHSPHLSVYNTGTGWNYADHFHCVEAGIEHKGTGDIFVHVDSSLTCYLSGIGNIRYKGSPKLEVKDQSGKGKIIPIK